VIFAQEAVISSSFLTADLPVSASILKAEWTWLETAGRLRFVSATWLFAAVALLVFAMVVKDLMEPTHKNTRLAASVVLALIFGLAIMPTYQFMQDPDALRGYHRLGGELFETALGRGTLPGCVAASDRWTMGACGEIPVIALLNRMMDVTNVFAGLGVGGLIVGMVLCLATPASDDLEYRAAQLEQNMLRMRRQLYLSGLVLTIGIFFATSWMRWPLPMVDAEHLSAYSSVIASALLFVGIYFSLLILSFYLPVAMILERRKHELAVAAARHDDLADHKAREGWLKMRGLQTDPTEFLKSGIALVAPILAAYAGSFPTFF
jgi:hypothetical protein